MHGCMCNIFKRGFFIVSYFFQHCLIGHPSDSTVSEDAGIEPIGPIVLKEFHLKEGTSGGFSRC
jgi:hypothetical protein